MRKKIDNRIRILIENGVKLGHRSMFVVVGDRGRDQVVILHHMLSKARVAARPRVLWCYKKDLGFTSHRRKQMKKIQKRVQSGSLDVNEDNPFELFVTATEIRYCYYSETHKILGNTFGMCVLQDFEALTPNLLARTIETVEGGGIIVILLQTITSLKQLFTLTMDVHSRYRTEAHRDVSGRFNERFILSLASCTNSMVVDDELNLLPISSHALNIESVDSRSSSDCFQESEDLKKLKESLQDTQPLGSLASCCKTLDQAKALLKFIEAITEKSLRSSTVSLTAARGRGKSAALGLAVSAAVAFSYSNIFVTSPSPENLKTLFEFVFKGFDALNYEEHLDYSVIQSTNPEFNKAVVRINIFHAHRQTIQYIHPSDSQKLGQAELVVIDEAAAIPLPLVKKLFGPYLVFLSSTINGYEGTGRSLSLKLLQQLRNQANPLSAGTGSNTNNSVQIKDKSESRGLTDGMSSALTELTIEESIRYKPGDGVEKWLNDLLCLNATNIMPMLSGCPLPQQCDLYYINRDTLFCYHKASEEFLQRIMSLYVASHYKNTPNDLQLMADAPAHQLYCLLAPVNPDKNSLPDVLVVIQICLEGEISRASVVGSLSRGIKASGDLIPWTISQQFQDKDFASLAGARIVRIATHPDYQNMGYGSRALNLLQDYFQLRMAPLENADHFRDVPSTRIEEIDAVNDRTVGLLKEQVKPRKSLPPLLLKLSERPPEHLDYLGVSYGLTSGLLKFWKRSKFVPVYLRQTPNDLTGEHTCIMLRSLNSDPDAKSSPSSSPWLSSFYVDFKRRLISLLGYQFRAFNPSMALGLLFACRQDIENHNVQPGLTKEEMDIHLTKYDLKRLEMYSRNLIDYHLVLDLLPVLSKLYFTDKLKQLKLSAVQSAILVGMGLQYKTVDELSSELQLMGSQLLGLFNRTMRQISQLLAKVEEANVERHMSKKVINADEMQPVDDSLESELDTAAQEIKRKQQEELSKLKSVDLSQYAIKGTDTEWSETLSTDKKVTGIVSLKRKQKPTVITEAAHEEELKKLKLTETTKLGGGSGKKSKKKKKKRHEAD